VFIICERAYALRKAAVMPQDLVDAVIAGRPLVGGKHTVLARIVEFAEQHKNDEGAVKAFARLEINRMERGVPYLDVIYAAAPLIGLTGTVTGLLQVFSQISPTPACPTRCLHQGRGAGAVGHGHRPDHRDPVARRQRLPAAQDRELRGAARRAARAHPPRAAAQ
jgi:hypothetical protein